MTDHEIEHLDSQLVIAPGAFRDLPDGPVPLRWGTDLDGPIIGYVTLSRLDARPEDPDDDLVGVGTLEPGLDTPDEEPPLPS